MPEDIKRSIYTDLGLEKNGVDYGSFLKEFDSNQELRKSVYKDLGLESNGVDFNSFEDKLGFKKKVQSTLSYEDFAQPFVATTSTGKRISGTDSPSPLKPQRSTSPSASTEEKNKLSFKPDLTIPWDKSPAGSEIKKEDKNADYLRVKQSKASGDIFVDYESDRAFKTLPAITQVALNKDSELKLASLEYFKNNPQEAAKMKAWQSDETNVGQGVRHEVMQGIYNSVLAKYVPQLEKLEESGVGVQLQNAQKFYGDFNKAIDDLKKAQAKLQFYQNNFIKSKGYEDIVTQGKQLNSKIKEFNIDAWKADSEKILADLNAAKANVEQYVVNGAVPREYQDKYAEAFSQYEYAVNVYNEHNNIPELQEYNSDVQNMASLDAESQNLLKEFEGNSDYKKAKEDYEAASQRVESMKPQAEELKKQQPLFSEYIQTARRVSSLVERIELANKGFPAPISTEQTRKRITKLYDEGYMNEATLRNWAGVLESLPKAVNSIASGIGSSLSKLTFGMAGDYNMYDKMADWYDGLNKFNTTILPTMKAYKELKDNTTKWDLAALGFQGLQQAGNMAVFATLGSYGKGAMVVTGYMMSRKERENEAKEAGLTGIQKEMYVSTLSTIEGLSELIMPDGQILTKEIKDLLLKDAVLAQTKGVNWFRKQAFKRISENTGKEILEEWTVSFTELMQKVAINYDNGNVFDVSKYKDINSWIETAAITAPLTILGSSYSEINTPKIELEMARFQAARNLTKSREILDDMVDAGNMTTEKADAEYKKIVNYAAVQSVMPKDISPAKAVEVSPLIIENKRLEIMLASGLDPVFEKQIKDRIRENITKAEEILSRPEESVEMNDEEMELGIVEAELSRPEEEKESGKKFYQGREFMEATGLRPDYYTQEEVDAAMKARGSKTEAAALEEAQTQASSKETKKAEEKLKQIWNSIGNNVGRSALEDGWAESFGDINETLSVGGENYQAHGMGKSGFASAIKDLFELFNKGIDPNRGMGRLYTAPLVVSEENKAAASAIGTAGGTAYTDGAFVLVAKKGVVGIRSINDIGGILVNSGLTDINPEILIELRKAFPNLVIENYRNAKGLVEQLNKNSEAAALEEAQPTLEQESAELRPNEEAAPVEAAPVEIKPEEIEAGKQEVGSVKEGKVQISNPIRLFKGLFGKRNADGTHRTAHAGVQGVFSSLDEKTAERYKGEDGVGTFEIPAGTTVEVVRISNKSVPVSEFRKQETEAINASDAQVVKLITIDAKGAEEQYIIKDPALIEKMQQPTESQAETLPKEQESKALKDVESTAKALRENEDKGGKNISTSIIPKEQFDKLNDGNKGLNDIISEAYHADKAAGKETELTKAVEQLLGKPKEAEVVETPTKDEVKVQKSIVEETPANIQEIANTVGENPNKVQNIYNKYGDKTKNISEITQEDYDKAVKAREKSKEKIKLEAIEAKIKQSNLTKLEAKKEASKIEELKKQDSKQVKEVEDFMDLLPNLQKAMLESGEIKTIDCKWGK